MKTATISKDISVLSDNQLIISRLFINKTNNNQQGNWYHFMNIIDLISVVL